MNETPPLELSTFLIIFIYTITISIFFLLLWLFKMYISWEHGYKLRSRAFKLKKWAKKEDHILKRMYFKLELAIIETIIKF